METSKNDFNKKNSRISFRKNDHFSLCYLFNEVEKLFWDTIIDFEVKIDWKNIILIIKKKSRIKISIKKKFFRDFMNFDVEIRHHAGKKWLTFKIRIKNLNKIKYFFSQNFMFQWNVCDSSEMTHRMEQYCQNGMKIEIILVSHFSKATMFSNFHDSVEFSSHFLISFHFNIKFWFFILVIL